MERREIFLNNPDDRHLSLAAKMLREGKLAIYPTDTVYGIGCSLFQKRALEQLYQVQGKSKFESMSLLCASIQQAAEYCQISNFAYKIIKRCLPGPFTVILEADRKIPKLMLSRRKEVGIRVPDSQLCQQLIEQVGHPLVNSSALIDEDGLEQYESVLDNHRLANQVSIFLDAGRSESPLQSTVIRIVGQEIEILREGKGDLDSCLG